MNRTKMNRKKIILASAVTALVVATGYGMYRTGMERGMRMAAPAASPGPSGAAGERKVLYWHDPMVPGTRFDKPGKSPFMDMPLAPVYADEGADEGGVAISPRVQQNLGIRTAEVSKGSLASSVEAVGSVAYNERDVVQLQARGSGFAEKLHVKAAFDRVRKGQVLAELYVPDWVAAQEEYLAVRRMGGAAGGLLDAARQRMRLAGMDDAQIRLVESGGRVQARLGVVAPVGGVVAELGVREGMTVAAGAPLFRINGLDSVWVNAEIPETAAAQLRVGSAVEARAPALPGTVLRGRIAALLPEVSAATRTLKARIEFANPQGALAPGMFVNLGFGAAERKDVLLVPSEAVIQTGKRSVVMLAQGDGAFRQVEVQTGAEAGGQTEIRGGLQAGQKVVVSGQFLVDSEASLKGAAARMEGAPAAGATHHGSGRVEGIGKEGVVISHGPIPSLQWGAMTMEFKPPAAGMPAGIAVGDMVEFELRQAGDGHYEITAIAPAAAGARQVDPHAGHAGAAK